MVLKSIKTIALATAIVASAGLGFATVAEAHGVRHYGWHSGWHKDWHRHARAHYGRAVYGYAAPATYGYGGGCGTYGYAGDMYAAPATYGYAGYGAAPCDAYGYGGGGLFGLGWGGGLFGLGLGPF